jgi:hypothetical protein
MTILNKIYVSGQRPRNGTLRTATLNYEIQPYKDDTSEDLLTVNGTGTGHVA